MASLYISVLFIGIIFQPIWCQQCDVVVISQAAIKEEIRAEVTNVLNGVSFKGNISTCNVEQLVERLCDLIEAKLENVTEKIENMTEKIEAKLETVTEKIISSMKEEIELYHQPGMTPSHPADSCADILHYIPASQSGYYWVKDINGYSHKVYCDMNISCGGVVGGWMKVAALDMTDINTQCPVSLRQHSDFNKRTCGINSAACSSVIFHTNTITYSKVGGKIKAYQHGSPDAFYRGSSNPSINSNYVDGISLTTKNPREHIWTFAAALDEVGTFPLLNCPCTNKNQANSAGHPPNFVGNDYFCDTASQERYQIGRFYSDPLWDGAGCGPLNSCCTLHNPPWFYKQLPQPTSDDIEMRVCLDQGIADEDIRIEMVDIYVH